MYKAREIIAYLTNLIWSTPDFFPIMVMLLLITGLVMTIRTRFVQIRLFVHSWKVMFGVYDNPGEPGDINHFQTISAVLSATVGIGNIAGVATAIHYGGPGALFWMWVTAALGMALKYSEATLAVKYRIQNRDASYSGGPMYYIERGLGRKWKWMSVIFASMVAIAALGIGNSIQSFTIADQLRSDFAVPTWISGLLSATMVGIVIIGGVKRIGRVTSFLSPFMCLLYLIGGLIILVLNYKAIPSSFKLVLDNAFTPTAGIGGFAGATFLYGMMWGVKRGLFSNEAGQGSAPILHAVAQTDEPPEEGANSMLGPFIDTIMVCTITGLVIIITGVWNAKHYELVLANSQAAIVIVTNQPAVITNSCIQGDIVKNNSFNVDQGIALGDYSFIRNHGVVDRALILLKGEPYTGIINVDENGLMKTENNEMVYLEGKMLQNGSILTSWAFQKGLGSLGNWGGYIVTVGVFLFAISTAIAWYFYGDRGVQYLFGDRGVFYYKWIYVGLHFLGAVVSLELVWGFGDVANGLMAIPNLIAVLLLSGVVKRDTYEYTHRRHYTAKEFIQLQNQGKI